MSRSRLENRLQHGRVVGLHDRAELVLGVALVPDQPLPVASQRPQLGQQRRGHRERPPVPVLVAQRIGQHERVECVGLSRRDPVSLPRAGRHLRRHAEQPVALVLQGLDQQPLGALDRDRGERAMPAQPPRQRSQACDVMGIRAWCTIRPCRSTMHS